MARLHLLEWEDQRWLPSTIRQGVTAYLNFVGNLSSEPYHGFVDALSHAMKKTGDRLLVDLCSGSAGPLPTLLGLLRQRGLEAHAVLTDLYPDRETLGLAERQSEGLISYESSPVDATQVPESLLGFRIVCNGFHHFEPALAQRILADAVKSGRGIALFEGVERRFPAMLVCALAVLAVPIATLFMRPWHWRRAFLTFLVPVIPCVTAWDGVVSCLRVYSPEELRKLIAPIPGADRYTWQIERQQVPRSPFGVTWLVGHPA